MAAMAAMAWAGSQHGTRQPHTLFVWSASTWPPVCLKARVTPAWLACCSLFETAVPSRLLAGYNSVRFRQDWLAPNANAIHQAFLILVAAAAAALLLATPVVHLHVRLRFHNSALPLCHGAVLNSIPVLSCPALSCGLTNNRLARPQLHKPLLRAILPPSTLNLRCLLLSDDITVATP